MVEESTQLSVMKYLYLMLALSFAFIVPVTLQLSVGMAILIAFCWGVERVKQETLKIGLCFASVALLIGALSQSVREMWKEKSMVLNDTISLSLNVHLGDQTCMVLVGLALIIIPTLLVAFMLWIVRRVFSYEHAEVQSSYMQKSRS